jgi:hypothetical protein
MVRIETLNVHAKSGGLSDRAGRNNVLDAAEDPDAE